MPAAGRMGDRSRVPEDAHGCSACPHTAEGPATGGSANVFVNSRPALRVGDAGTHAACCGANIWEAVGGAPGVVINERPAHRRGDAVNHCGGVGELIEGSDNVIFGNGVSWPAVPAPHLRYDEAFVVVDRRTGEPLLNRPYRLTRENGDVIEGVTDRDGHTVVVRSTYVEPLHLDVLDHVADQDPAGDDERFRLEVVDPSGTPLAGRKATLFHDGRTIEVTLDERGVAFIDGLDHGLASDVHVWGHGCLASHGAVELDDDRSRLPDYSPGHCDEEEPHGC